MIDGLTLGNFRSMHAHGAPSVGFTADDVSLLPYLSAYTRQTYESGGKAQLDSKNWRGYARQHSNTPEEQKLQKLLKCIDTMTERPGGRTDFDCGLHFPLIDAASADHCYQLLYHLKDDGYIQAIQATGRKFLVNLTVKGRKHLDEISRQVVGEMDFEAVPEAAR